MSKYDQPFRDEAVRLVLSTNQSIKQTALNLGIEEYHLYSWVRKARESSPLTTDESGNETNLVDELNILSVSPSA